jgi:hypothetical protein
VIRVLAGLALAMVIGLILGTDASAPVAVLVGVAGVLGLSGIFGHSFSLMGISAGLLLVAYSLALVIVAPAPGVVIPVLVGCGLTLLLTTSERATRGWGTSVDHQVFTGWLGDVVGVVGLAGVGGIALGMAGRIVILGLPAWGYPVIAGGAALAAVVGTGRALIASARPSGVDRSGDA